MKLGKKLLAAPLLTAIVVFAIGQLTLFLVSLESDVVEKTVLSQYDDYRTLSNAQEQIGEIHTMVYRSLGLIGAMDDSQLASLRTSLAQQLSGFKRVIEGASSLASRDEESATLIAALGKLSESYGSQIDLAISKSSSETGSGAGFMVMRTADATFTDMAQTTRNLIQHVDELSAETIEQAQNRARLINLGLAGVGLLSVLVAIWLSWRMQRGVVAELEHASQIASEVAQGNLDLHIETRRSDEVGDMLRSLAAMTHQLNHSMSEVRLSAESLRLTSDEISAGTHDLSNRTEQAASNLQAAASAIEQLSQTVSQTADAARAANELAHASASVAAQGGSAVSLVVGTMDGINASSSKIADIIGVIDGIAFQTNILALNAAVEAARAGEQGRGFAVVATEVRSLAGRSSVASRQIRDLIGASVQRVEAGSQQASQAGQTMSEIVGSAQKVADIISQITLATAEQSVGIKHVNESLVQLDQMTQQNAALVEESTAASSSQRDHALRLVEVVRTFRLKNESPA
jgi:methyl-accepting chemotaxis protein